MLGVFFLYSLRCMLFANKTNIHIELIFVETMVDLTQVNMWSWRGMVLAHLYPYLHESIRTDMRTMVDNATLLMVINL